MLAHRLVLLRHGETQWSRTGRHTSRTEIDLTDVGIQQAKAVSGALEGLRLVDPLVWCSPRKRASMTAELAGLAVNEVSPLLSEWSYGMWEGLTTPEVRQWIPDWLVWTHGCEGGESVHAVGDRADRVVTATLEHIATRDVVLVGHGHFSRAVMCRWIQQPVAHGIRLSMPPASIAVCGTEHGVRQLSALGLT